MKPMWTEKDEAEFKKMFEQEKKESPVLQKQLPPVIYLPMKHYDEETK